MPKKVTRPFLCRPFRALNGKWEEEEEEEEDDDDDEEEEEEEEEKSPHV